MRLHRRFLGVTVAVLGLVGPGRALAQSECLVEVRQQDGGTVADGATLCQTATGKRCTFQLGLCVNGDGCTPADLKHKNIRASGRCVPFGKLHVKGKGTSSVCGAFTGIKLKTKKHGTKAGTCRIRAKAGADTDTITLNCQPASDPCTTTTTAVSTTTTTTLRCGNGIIDSGEVCDPPGGQAQCPAGQACAADCASCAQVTCDPIVPGQAIVNSYNLQAAMGPKFCTPESPANALGPCQSDTDCGCTMTTCCFQTPWVDAGGIALPFPLGVSATYTISSEDSPPTCNHQACIGCGDPNATCPGLTGCNGGNPNCISSPATCCDQPGFIVPTFFLSSLSTCVKVDQKACGVGVVNSSNPQTGDNEVIKTGDTSDPGADCCYNNDSDPSHCIGGVNNNDDPAAKPCDTTTSGAGNDKKGKVLRTLGNGTPDASGIQTRLGVSIMATAFTDKAPQAPGASCPGNDTFDTGEILLAQLALNAELSTAGASGEFVDMNGDSCAVAGFGFSGGSTGPVSLSPPTVSPAPYGGGTNLMGSVGLVFAGPGVTHDLGFTALVPFSQPTVTPSQTCTCNPTPGCPE